MAASEGDAYHITLVHGTFAAGAPWTQEGSALRRALGAALPNATFHTFAWSGRNSYADRAEAGKRLAAFLDERAAAAPQARHAVIAHSHGGNVALYAGKHTQRPEGLPNIACLATPFIACAPIPKPLFGGALLWGLCALVVSAVAGLSGYGASKLLRGAGVEEGTAALILLPFLLLAAAVGPFWLHRQIATRMARSAKARLAELAWPELVGTRLLTVGYEFDEAKTYLDYLNRATSKLSRNLWRKAEVRLLALLAFAFLAPFVAELFGLPPPLDTDTFREIEVPFILTIYALAAAALVLPVLRSHPYGYGWERLTNSWTLNITAADRPDGLVVGSFEDWRIPVGEFRKRDQLAHTIIYDDPRVHRKLIEWLREGA